MTSPENYSIVDRRGRTASGLQIGGLTQEMNRLRQAGVTLPASGPRGRAKTAQITEMVNSPGSLAESARVEAQMRRSRMATMQRTASNVQMAMPRVREPLGTLRNQNIPCDYNDPKALAEARAWCNTPDAPVWMADYSFKAIGDIQPGDQVIGWEREWQDCSNKWGSGYQKGKRTLVPTTVLAVNRRTAPEVVLITFESGRTVKCTPDHEWLRYYTPNPQGYIRNGPGKSCSRTYDSDYAPLKVGDLARFVIPETPELTPEQQSAADYLAGIIDGEGCMSKGAIRISQSLKVNSHVVERIDRALETLAVAGLKYRRYVRWKMDHLGQGHMVTWDLTNCHGNARNLSKWNMVHLYNWCHPAKMTAEKMAQLVLTSRFGSKDRVVSIEPLGPGEVVSMQTTTGNYTAWGYASKNCHLFYATHDLVPLLIDIYSRFPLTGLEFTSTDSRIEQAFSEMFLDDLDYEDWLPNALGREYMLSGEVTALGHFDEELGVWTSEEILDPDMVRVSKSLFVDQERVQLAVKDLVESLQNPPKGGASESRSEELDRHHQLQQLKKYYPEILAAAAQDDGLDIAEPRWSRLVNRVSPWDLRGVPPLMRSFGTLMLEESLYAAQTSVADRLYSPMLVATLGIQDMGDGQPWIPTQDDLSALRDDLQTALMADFKLITHHMGLKIESVFGRESVPRFDQDYERVDMKLMQAWGIGAALIMGGTSAAGTYASSALNREVCELNMRDFQRKVIKHIKKRAEVVAEAQRFYDYERKFSPGLGRTPVYRKVLRFNEETGQQEVVKTPKLLIPTIRFNSLNLRDEATERQFYMELKQMGVPVSDKTLAINLDTDFDTEITRTAEEQVDKIVAQAEAMSKAQQIIDEKNRHLPLEEQIKYPPDLINYLTQTTVLRQQLAAAKMAEGQNEMMDQQAKMMTPAGQLGILPPPAVLPPPPGEQQQQGPQGPPEPLANRTRPPESDEMRAGAPRAAAKRGVKADGDTIIRKRAFFEDPMSSYGDRYRVSPDDVEQAVQRRELTARHPHPLVSDLVNDPDFFSMLNSPHEDQIRADYADIAAGKGKDSESARLLHELVDQYSYLTGREPQWD